MRARSNLDVGAEAWVHPAAAEEALTIQTATRLTCLRFLFDFAASGFPVAAGASGGPRRPGTCSGAVLPRGNRGEHPQGSTGTARTGSLAFRAEQRAEVLPAAILARGHGIEVLDRHGPVGSRSDRMLALHAAYAIPPG